MADWYKEPKTYHGTFDIDAFSLPVAFTAGIDMEGVAKISMDAIPMDLASSFVDEYFFAQKTKFAEFTLMGAAADGASFESQRALVYSPRHYTSDTAPATITPRLGCMVCNFVDSAPADSPRAAKSLLRDFKNFQTLRADTPLGAVEMVGANSLKTEGVLSGRIEIIGLPDISDLADWRAKVAEFFAHTRSVMSFASGARLQAPIAAKRNGLSRCDVQSH